MASLQGATIIPLISYKVPTYAKKKNILRRVKNARTKMKAKKITIDIAFNFLKISGAWTERRRTKVSTIEASEKTASIELTVTSINFNCKISPCCQSSQLYAIYDTCLSDCLF